MFATGAKFYDHGTYTFFSLPFLRLMPIEGYLNMQPI